MSSFIAATGAEFTKTFTTRMWWVLAVVAFGYVALMAGGLAAIFGFTSSQSELPEGMSPIPGGGEPSALIYSFASSIGYVFPVLLGALAVTNEFRHRTLTPTFLATPRRGLVLGGKLVALFVMGGVFGVVGVLGSVGLGAPILAAFDLETELGASDTWAMIGRILLAMALWGVVGVALGTMVPSQVGSIVIILAFTQFVEPTLRAVTMLADWAADVGKFLPGAASDALVGASFFSVVGGGGEALEWWQGGLVLLAYAVVFAVIGYLTSWKRDIT